MATGTVSASLVKILSSYSGEKHRNSIFHFLEYSHDAMVGGVGKNKEVYANHSINVDDDMFY